MIFDYIMIMIYKKRFANAQDKDKNIIIMKFMKSRLCWVTIVNYCLNKIEISVLFDLFYWSILSSLLKIPTYLRNLEEGKTILLFTIWQAELNTQSDCAEIAGCISQIFLCNNTRLEYWEQFLSTVLMVSHLLILH